jgi:tetratricopeptide (TPR) repeat protein
MNQCKRILVILVFAMAAIGQDYGIPGEYLTLNFPSSAAMGFGGGSAALTDNSDALYLNVAGLAFAKYLECSIGYARFGTGLNYYPAAFCAPLGKIGSVGLSYVGHLSPEAPGYDNFGIQRESYRAGANSITLGYAHQIVKILSIGASVRIASERVATYSDVGFGLDLALQVRPLPWISAGASFVNLIPPKLRLHTSGVSYGTTLRGGLGVYPLYPFMSSSRAKSLVFYFDGQMDDLLADESEFANGNVYRATRAYGGIAFEPLEFLVIRAGVNDRLIDMGAGITAKGITTDIALGIHYGTEDMELGPDFSFGIRYAFGRPLSKQQADVDLKEKIVNDKAELSKARELYIDGKYDDAKIAVELYCNANPNDRAAAKFLDEINIKRSSGNAFELIRQAQTELDKGNYTDAAKLVDQAISIAPSDTTVMRMKKTILVKTQTNDRLKNVALLYDQKKMDEVEKELEVIVALDSSNSETNVWRKKIEPYLNKRNADRLVAQASKNYYDLHDVENASSDLQKALAIDPENKDGLALYEKISREVKEMYLKKVGQMVEGQNLAANDTNLKKLVLLDIQDRILRIRRLLDDKQYDQALTDVDVVLRESPNDTQAVALKIRAENGLRVKNGEVAYSEALKNYNDGNYEDAQKRINAAVVLDSTNVKAKQLRIDIMKKSRQSNIEFARKALENGTRELLDQADAKIAEYLKIDSSNTTASQLQKDVKAQLLVLDATVAIDAGLYERAQVLIQDALRISPDNRKVQDAYKNLKDAVEMLK